MMPYALFDRDERVGELLPTELDVWKQVLEAGLISDLPVADEDCEEVLPPGFYIRKIEQMVDPAPEWMLPNEIS